MISAFRMALLVMLIRPLLRQGPNHQGNATMIFSIVRKCWAAEFTEDNRVTHNANLTDLFHESRRYL